MELQKLNGENLAWQNLARQAKNEESFVEFIPVESKMGSSSQKDGG